MDKIIEMRFEKSTKNKHVYVAEGSAVPSIYIDKSALPASPVPTTIKVTISHV